MESSWLENEWMLLNRPSFMIVEQPVAIHAGIVLPCRKENADDVLKARFATMTCEDYWAMEPHMTTYETIKGPVRDEKIPHVSIYEMKRQLIRRLLRDWNLDIPIEVDEVTGWLTEECWQRVTGLPGPLVMALVGRYENDLFPSEDDEIEVDRQCAMLFSTHGTGVQNPCETVSLYCITSNFWDKFGLNRHDIQKLPYREFVRLRGMVSRENRAFEARRKHDEQQSRGHHRRVGPGMR